MESYHIHLKNDSKIDLERVSGQMDPQGAKDHRKSVGELEILSRIIQELNDRFGTEFAEEDKVFIRQLDD